MASALVTGGTKRIGKAIALDLAKQGYDKSDSLQPFSSRRGNPSRTDPVPRAQLSVLPS